MKSNKTQKRNPHQLTKKQHVFPARSLARFTDSEGKLAVRRSGIRGDLMLRPDNRLFCANRVWDHGAESGFMQSIEREFQMIADQLVKGRRTLEVADGVKVTEFFALWQLRAEMKANPSDHAPLIGIAALSREYTIDEQEMLEKADLGYINPDRTVSSRWVASAKVSIGLLDYKKRLHGVRWGVVLSSDGEFAVPDQFRIAVVPVAPKICLVAGLADSVFSADQVADLNRRALTEERQYCVARSFAACPV